MSYKIQYNNKEYIFDKPITILQLVGPDKSFLCAYVNNKIRELTYLLYEDAIVEPLTIKNRYSKNLYTATLRFVIAMAMKDISDKPIRFLNGISRSLYMCFEDDSEITNELIEQLKCKMNKIISEDIPLIREKVLNEEAYKIFYKEGYIEKAEMTKYRPEKESHLYSCNGYKNYMYNRMLPSTGYVTSFNLIKYQNGVIIQYPRYDFNGEIPTFENDEKFHKTLQESRIWAKTTKADTVIGINHKIENGGEIDFINLSEAKHNLQLANLGDIILKNPSIRLICIAGPSSSGKTTFANRLRIELLSRGIEPIRISLDDYYKNKQDLPLDENGDYDRESIEALDVSLFVKQMNDLIAGKEVELPIYEFSKGRKTKGRLLKIRDEQPLIIEGIHALNDAITKGINKEYVFKIFIAPTIQVSIDNENPLSTTDLRLLRRIVRDYKYRSTTVLETLKMWDSVRRGEFAWIYKTEENADYIFNSFLPYELCLLKDYAMPLLNEIEMNSEYFPLAERLIRMLKFFEPIDEKWVPCNSLIREFIGGSCYQDV